MRVSVRTGPGSRYADSTSARTVHIEEVEAMAAHRPFTIHVPDATLDDLRTRLDRVRWPDEIPGGGWRYGSDLTYMKALVAYWAFRVRPAPP